MVVRITAVIIALGTLSVACSTDEAGEAEDGDAMLRAATAAAPRLEFERIEFELSPELDVAEISGLSADAQRNVYIFQRGSAADPIIVTDASGNQLRSFGRGLFARPHSIRIDAEQNVWTVDSNTSIVRQFSPAGELLLTIDVGDVPDPTNPSCAAADIAFDRVGLVYVADGYCNARIVVYDATGEKVREWGSAGTGPGQFNLPHGIAVSPEGNIYVADRENGRVQWFTPEGTYLGEWQFGGRILSVAFSPEGDFFISAEPKGAEPQREATLLQIDRADGSILGKLEEFGHEIDVGPDGTLLPASLSDRITMYRPR